MLISTGMMGWHTLLVNDMAFHRNRLRGSLFRLAVAVTTAVVSIGLAVSSREYAAAGCLAAMAVNWNFYSLVGKHSFLTALAANFCGGMLHFAIGAAFAGAAIDGMIGYALYFGFTMAGASMHHDAVDAEEDAHAGYVTGAVRFGRVRWWRFGVVPIATANAILALHCARDALLLAAFGGYLVVYCRFRRGPFDTDRLHAFRLSCRAIYGLSGGLYIAERIIRLT